MHIYDLALALARQLEERRNEAKNKDSGSDVLSAGEGIDCEPGEADCKEEAEDGGHGLRLGSESEHAIKASRLSLEFPEGQPLKLQLAGIGRKLTPLGNGARGDAEHLG